MSHHDCGFCLCFDYQVPEHLPNKKSTKILCLEKRTGESHRYLFFGNRGTKYHFPLFLSGRFKGTFQAVLNLTLRYLGWHQSHFEAPTQLHSKLQLGKVGPRGYIDGGERGLEAEGEEVGQDVMC